MSVVDVRASTRVFFSLASMCRIAVLGYRENFLLDLADPKSTEKVQNHAQITLLVLVRLYA